MVNDYVRCFYGILIKREEERAQENQELKDI